MNPHLVRARGVVLGAVRTGALRKEKLAEVGDILQRHLAFEHEDGLVAGDLQVTTRRPPTPTLVSPLPGLDVDVLCLLL